MYYVSFIDEQSAEMDEKETRWIANQFAEVSSDIGRFELRSLSSSRARACALADHNSASQIC
jgi:hypothetical protein